MESEPPLKDEPKELQPPPQEGPYNKEGDGVVVVEKLPTGGQAVPMEKEATPSSSASSPQELEQLKQRLKNLESENQSLERKIVFYSQMIENFIGRILPEEVLRLIMSFLDAKSLCSVSGVNKTFRRLSNDDHLWSSLYKQVTALPKPVPSCSWRQSYCNFYQLEKRKGFINEIMKDDVGKIVVEYDDSSWQTLALLAKTSIGNSALFLIRFGIGIKPIPKMKVKLFNPVELAAVRSSSRWPDLCIKSPTATWGEALALELNTSSSLADDVIANYTIPSCDQVINALARPNSCREKIILVIDVDQELESMMFRGKNYSVTIFEVLKAALKWFVKVKLSINQAHQFAICLATDTTELYQDFTNDPDLLDQVIDQICIRESPSTTYDFSTLTQLMLDLQKQKGDREIFRVILFYGRSTHPPQNEATFGTLVFSSEFLFYDMCYLHKPPNSLPPQNQHWPQNIYDQLTSVYRKDDNNYFMEHSTSWKRFYNSVCCLLSHPSFRKASQLDNLKSLETLKPLISPIIDQPHHPLFSLQKTQTPLSRKRRPERQTSSPLQTEDSNNKKSKLAKEGPDQTSNNNNNNSVDESAKRSSKWKKS